MAVKIYINDQEVLAKEGQTILEAALENGYYIPTLCYHKDLCVAGNCRVCLVEVEGARTLLASCTTPVQSQMKIKTNSPLAVKARKTALELLLAEHVGDCYTCPRNFDCELQELSYEMGIVDLPFEKRKEPRWEKDYTTAIIRDNDKCILCTRCVRTCEELQKVEALKPVGRGHFTHIGTFFEEGLGGIACTLCGQCVNRCPTGALFENSPIDAVWAALEDPTKHVVVQTAPAIRASIGEEFGLPPGTRVTGKLVAALRRLGFDHVGDTDFTADLTIIEEGNEFLSRLKRKFVDGEDVALPMITSCSPGWIKYIEHFFPEELDHLSTCKSPQQMFGALAKTYYAQKLGKKPEEIVVVSIMPCTAKKYEASRPEMNASGVQDVDYVLTTRELAKMIKQAGYDLKTLPEDEYDKPFGITTGAGVIFGATGGVMEAALRTVYEVVTGKEVPFERLRIEPVRGLDGVKEASITIQGTMPEWSFLEGVTVKVAVAHGLANAFKVMQLVREGKADYQFIEVMACPGGCIGGGGQPRPTTEEIRAARIRAIYEEDEVMRMRKSHENPVVKTLYEEFLEKPNSHTAHELLHTHYTPRTRY
jgi:iron-only hydrogenase group A